MNKYLEKIASDLSIARTSLGEEEKAIKDYAQRLKDATDPALKKAITHARDEEKTHAAGFKKVIEEEMDRS